jgi:carboxymethylenebutenolidase
MQSVSQAQIVFTSGGKQVRVDCFLPTSYGQQRLPAIIGLHGSGGSSERMAEPASLLAAQGFAVYVPHYFERTGTTSAGDKATILRHFFAWAKTLWDTISLVGRQPEVNPDRIGLLGFSLGAYLALSVASMDSRVQAVAEFFGGFPKEIKFFIRRFCPVLILHGDADQTVPVQEAFDLQRLLEKRKIPYEINIYPGVGHGFTGEIWQDACARSLAFFQKYLRGDSLEIKKRNEIALR